MNAHPDRWRFLAAILLSAALLGCGEPPVGVRGHVTLDGQPIESGSISFEPIDGNGTTSGGLIENGAYELMGRARIAPGPKLVRIRATRKTGRRIPRLFGSTEMMDEVKEYIPPRYNNQSTLKVDVEPGKVAELNFDLTSR